MALRFHLRITALPAALPLSSRRTPSHLEAGVPIGRSECTCGAQRCAHFD
jgi:hypothetical protein